MIAPIADSTGMFNKDTFVAVGVIITAFIGLLNLGYSFRNNRRSSYVGSVTATRLKWIGEVRDNLSRYIALLHERAVSPPPDPAEYRKLSAEITRYRMLLRLQLAPDAAELDNRFQEQIESVYNEALSMQAAELEPRLSDLVVCGQRFLWTEWLKVKKEAIYGDPYDTWPRRFDEWVKQLGSASDWPVKPGQAPQ